MMHRHPIEHWCVRYRISLVLMIISIILTSSMMLPSMAMLTVMFSNILVLSLMRISSRIEGHRHG